MDDEIAQYREELKRRPPGDTGRETALYNLAESTRKRFKRTDDIEDIMEAIELHRTALELRPEGHPDCHSLLCQLTWCLIQRILKFSVAFVCVCLYSTGYSTKWGTIPSFLYTVLKAEALYVQFEISTMVRTMPLNTW